MWGPPSRGALLICILVSGPGLSPSAQSLVSCLSFSQLPPATPLPAQPEVCAPSEALMQRVLYGVLGVARESVRCPEQAGLNQASGALLSGADTYRAHMKIQGLGLPWWSNG